MSGENLSFDDAKEKRAGVEQAKRMMLLCVCVAGVVSLLMQGVFGGGDSVKVRELSEDVSRLESEVAVLKENKVKMDTELDQRQVWISGMDGKMAEVKEMAKSNSESRAALTGDRWTATNHDRYAGEQKFWITRQFDGYDYRFGKLEERVLRLERGGVGMEVEE